MKLKMIKCDTCGKDITNEDIRYKFKQYENSYVNYEDFDFTKWSRLNMCAECFLKLQGFVTGELGKYKRIYCKDCKYYHPYNLMCNKYNTIMRYNDFCSYAVKKTDEVCEKMRKGKV